MTPIKLKALINEILSELEYERFPTMKGSCITPEGMVDMLNKELERLKAPAHKREKKPVDEPIITKGMIQKAMVGDKDSPDPEAKKIDINNIIEQLTDLPKTIFDEGEKSIHSTTEEIQTINTGIPAFRGVMWDSKKKEFFLLNTCPGAGKCVIPCYALHGFYRMNDGKVTKLARRLQLLVDNPDKYEAMAFDEADSAAYMANKKGKILFVRWNDAGDFFDDEYLNIAIRVTNKLRQKGLKVQSYAYTKVASAFKKGDENDIIMNFSSGANFAEKIKMKDLIKQAKMSETVPTALHQPFWKRDENNKLYRDRDDAGNPVGKPHFKDEAAKIGLKRAIYEEYNNKEKYPELAGFSFESLKYTDELPKAIGQKNEFNVIVYPYGDSDVGAQRRDVRISFLCQH